MKIKSNCIFYCFILFLANWGYSSEPVAISWKDLAGLDTKTGELNSKLSNYLNQKVTISGFAIVLEQGKKPNTMLEFALVPDLMYCYHVPPPPPNQILEVFLKNEESLNLLAGAIKVTGKLKVQKLEGREYKYGFHFFPSEELRNDIRYSGTGAVIDHKGVKH